MKTKKYQLKNGLTVLFAQSHKSPVVSVQMWVRTGSADEDKGEEGLSHFIEHLVFKGSQKYKVGEIAATVEGHGGELNAYTSFDQTVFYVTISKHFLSKGLEIISEMMVNPSFDSDEIDNEREVVIEEIKRTMDNPHRQASRTLFSTMYKKHPYGIPVIGYAENIKNVSREKILDYFHRRYTPKNMTLLVSGDFESKETKKEVEKLFSDFSDRKFKKSKRNKEPEQNRTRVKVQQQNFEETLLHLGWRGPRASQKDAVALDVLAMIFGGGESSRLMHNLRIENNITKYAVASTFLPQDPGFIAVSLGLLQNKTTEALNELLKQFEQILTSPPSHQELTKVINNIESDEFYSLQTVDGIARKLGSYENLFGDHNYHKEFLQQVSQLKPKDITRVAKKYFNPNKLTATLITPGNAKKLEAEIKQFIKDFKKLYRNLKPLRAVEEKPGKRKPMKWSPTAKRTGKPKKIQLGNGASLILWPNSDSPVVSLKMASLGGLRLETDANNGISELASRVWVSNTRDKNERQIIADLDSLASSVSAFAGRNSMGMSSSMLSPVADKVWEIYADTATNFKLSDEVVEREKHQLIESIKSRKDKPAQLAIRSFLENLFYGHPYGKDPNGTIESLTELRAPALTEHLERHTRANKMHFAIVGDIDEAVWQQRVEDLTNKMLSQAEPSPEFDLSAITENKKTFTELNKEQTHIVFGYRGLCFDDDRKPSMQLIQSILAGQGGRLFIELRDKNSLAYSVSPLRMEGIDTGYFAGYIACSPEKAKKSIEMMRAEFHKLAETKVPEAELNRAKRYLIGRHDIDLQKNSAICSNILFDDLYGLDFLSFQNFKDEIDQVSAADIQKLARELFSQNEIISVVGASNPF